QSDYYQATRGGGHGDYRMPVYAPASVQEAVELTQRAFDVADKYRTPVMILGDGIIGQMMEPVTMPEYAMPSFDKNWAATGWREGCGRDRAVINSLYIQPDVLEKHVNRLAKKYEAIRESETMVEQLFMENAEYAVVAYGTTARIALTAIRRARQDGVRVGLIRPVTVWPFPEKAIEGAAARVKGILTVEMSLGQMLDDVRLFSKDKCPVRFYGRTGGIVPGVREIHAAILAMKEEL
ncbi:MAG: 3-methyl-2-oxobutanoate dehydrogenase subunit beta, partial [Clostridiales bacterium]|nr:3-methyl-2-oxobutanoate dehydrogenase subunit beta [Clostridiales bacterium]